MFNVWWHYLCTCEGHGSLIRTQVCLQNLDVSKNVTPVVPSLDNLYQFQFCKHLTWKGKNSKITCYFKTKVQSGCLRFTLSAQNCKISCTFLPWFFSPEPSNWEHCAAWQCWSTDTSYLDCDWSKECLATAMFLISPIMQ